MKKLVLAIAISGLVGVTGVSPVVAAPNDHASCTGEIRQPWGGLDGWARAGLGGDWGAEVKAVKHFYRPIGQTFCDPFPPAGG